MSASLYLLRAMSQPQTQERQVWWIFRRLEQGLLWSIPQNHPSLVWKTGVFPVLWWGLFLGPGRGRKAWLIFLMTALLKLSISHHSISFSLSSDLFYWMVKGEPCCLKLMIRCFDLVFYLLKNISIAQNLWQYVGNTDGKNMTLISSGAWLKK